MTVAPLKCCFFILKITLFWDTKKCSFNVEIFFFKDHFVLEQKKAGPVFIAPGLFFCKAITGRKNFSSKFFYIPTKNSMLVNYKCIKNVNLFSTMHNSPSTDATEKKNHTVKQLYNQNKISNVFDQITKNIQLILLVEDGILLFGQIYWRKLY